MEYRKLKGYRVYTNLQGSIFENFIYKKNGFFAPEEHPVCSEIRGEVLGSVGATYNLSN